MSRAPPVVAQGMLLVAAGPAGSMANLYVYLARANVALSVVLTALSCLAAVLTMPLIVEVYHVVLGKSMSFGAPAPAVVGQLLLTLIAPILLGMAIRRVRPNFAERHRRALFEVNLIALAALTGLVVIQKAECFARDFYEIAGVVAALTGLARVVVYTTGRLAQAGPADRFRLAMVFVVRNVGVATMIAVTVLGQHEFAVFAAAYFLSQTFLLLAAGMGFRFIAGSERSTTQGTDDP